MRLVLFSKFPTPGEAKTRLIPALGEEGAAQVHRRLAERTVGVLLASNAGAVEIGFTGASETKFRDWLHDWPAEELTFAEQAVGDLTARLIDRIEPAPVLFFGADTPDLSPEIVRDATQALRDNEVVIGPAEDGGYYLIGIARPMPELFTDMPWSTSEVLPETLRRLAISGIEPIMLPTLSDCDRPEDLARWPWLTA